MSLDTAVAFIIFNRPETTSKVFAEIAKAQPSKLYIIADGPRPNRADDINNCSAARAIVENVDWECEVYKNYSEINLGCRRRVSSGIDWVFAHVEQAIILEDDCVPDQSFFQFCEELLDRYKDVPKVMHISGVTFSSEKEVSLSRDYSFSRYPHVWGWATWRRAWQYYDVEMNSWTKSGNKSAILKNFTHLNERDFWKRNWDLIVQGQIDTWDYQWVFACIANEGFCIRPSTNLISNIGFHESATHTKNADSPLSKLPRQSVVFPLKHPVIYTVDVRGDEIVSKLFFQSRSKFWHYISSVKLRVTKLWYGRS